MVLLAKPCVTWLYKAMQFSVIILAAGQGKRLKSAIPKPLHQLAGRPLISWVINAANDAGASTSFIVTGADYSGFIGHIPVDAELITQHPLQGTGHAVACCIEKLSVMDPDHPVVILYADTPLIQPATITKLATEVASSSDICCLAFRSNNPTGYGRMLTENGKLTAIVEEKDASPEQQKISLVNGGVMSAKAGILCELLPQLEKANAQDEYYLTDLVMLANKIGNKASFLKIEAEELTGINDRQQLAELEAVIQVKLRRSAMLRGVSMLAPDTVYLSSDTEFGRDIVIEPNVVIRAGCKIGDGCHIKAFSHLEGVIIGPDCIIGPHARLRPGTILETGVKIGNFVETKNAHFETGAKANHLSYLGDATIGTDANIGAGVITCNYDGFNKSKTNIGANAFIGSNSALVAPVKIGDYAIIGAGSVIAETVDAHALSLTRVPQKTLNKGADKFRIKAKSKQGREAT